MNFDDANVIVALRGWHPAISRAETESMFPEVSIRRTEARRLLIADGESDWNRADIMSGCECILTGGGIAKWESIPSLLEKIRPMRVSNMAVMCWRHEGKIPVKTKEIEMEIGGKFQESGSTFNLTNPDNRFGVVLDNSAGLVAWGWMKGQGPGKHGWSAMRANKRPFFRPVSIEPRIARAAVNIACGDKSGLVIDPMCGTGGIIIEAALSHRKALGIDFDPVMVEGTKQNLEWAGLEAEVIRGDATNCQIPKDALAVVVDPPYGRNSVGDKRLLQDTITNITKQTEGCRFVIILPKNAGQTNLDECINYPFSHPSLKIHQAFEIPVHKSLGRVMIIAEAKSDN
tara:strand:- start:31 stop:1062 length:1032 start_codon:yes stop_codon:yes gene_type:complete